VHRLTAVPAVCGSLGWGAGMAVYPLPTTDSPGSSTEAQRPTRYPLDGVAADTAPGTRPPPPPPATHEGIGKGSPQFGCPTAGSAGGIAASPITDHRRLYSGTCLVLLLACCLLVVGGRPPPKGPLGGGGGGGGGVNTELRDCGIQMLIKCGYGIMPRKHHHGIADYGVVVHPDPGSQKTPCPSRALAFSAMPIPIPPAPSASGCRAKYAKAKDQDQDQRPTGNWQALGVRCWRWRARSSRRSALARRRPSEQMRR
jgi:hypothetical protein